MMKKLAVEVAPQLDVAAELAQIKATQSAILARLEKLDPTPKLETIEPYAVGSTVYHVSDTSASYPFTVVGYDHRACRILVQGADDMERRWPLESVQSFDKCQNASQTSEQAEREAYKNLDPATREFILGRKRAQIDAIIKPSAPSLRPQYRYDNEPWVAK
jgi:hypothetical protein